MDLEIDLSRSPAGTRLVEPDELRSFRVVVLESPVRAPAWPALVARHDEHVWVAIEALRELAGPGRSAGWEAGFGAMIEYARSKGWVDDETGSVRGHVERRCVP